MIINNLKQDKMDNSVKVNVAFIERLANLGQEIPGAVCYYTDNDVYIKTDAYGLIRLVASNINGVYRFSTDKDVIYLWEDRTSVCLSRPEAG